MERIPISEPAGPVLIPQPVSAVSPDLLRDHGLLPGRWLELPAPVQQKALGDTGSVRESVLMSPSKAGVCEVASPVGKPLSDVQRPLTVSRAFPESPESAGSDVATEEAVPETRKSGIVKPRLEHDNAIHVSTDRPGRGLRILRFWVWVLALVAWTLVLIGVRL